MWRDRRASDADNMTDEVDAIRAVGRALAQLPDNASRVRVLRWAAERFQIDTILAPAAEPSRSPVKAAVVNRPDLTLSMDGLHDLFPARKDQDRARVFDSDLLTLDAAPIAPVAPVDDLDATASIGVDVVPIEETPVEVASPSGSVLHSFVHDFQRLASDCQTLFAS